jgi:hypothetical protein
VGRQGVRHTGEISPFPPFPPFETLVHREYLHSNLSRISSRSFHLRTVLLTLLTVLLRPDAGLSGGQYTVWVHAVLELSVATPGNASSSQLLTLSVSTNRLEALLLKSYVSCTTSLCSRSAPDLFRNLQAYSPM